MAGVLLTVRRVLGLFSDFWKPLAVISLLIMAQKVCDLLVPWFGGRVIDAMARGQALATVLPLVLTAFTFWLFHGNVLPYVLGRFDVRRFHYPARQSISVGNIRTVLACRAAELRRNDTAMQQAVIERGEQVLIDFITSLFRVALPISIPGLVTLGLLLWWFPMIGIIAIIGGSLDVLVTLWLNKIIAPLYGELQQFDYRRQRLQTQIFREVAAIFAGRRERETAAEYEARYTDYASVGIAAGVRFLGFNFGRGVIINVTNLCTWLVGVWYVSTGVYSLGFFLASLSWSTYVINMLGAALELQKQWLETMPAIRAYFEEIDALREAPAPAAAEGPAPAEMPALARVA
jgi:ABC-type bacteriocin/lantibiotic exporter with double-glycine peptidase domain